MIEIKERMEPWEIKYGDYEKSQVWQLDEELKTGYNSYPYRVSVFIKGTEEEVDMFLSQHGGLLKYDNYTACSDKEIEAIRTLGLDIIDAHKFATEDDYTGDYIIR